MPHKNSVTWWRKQIFRREGSNLKVEKVLSQVLICCVTLCVLLLVLTAVFSNLNVPKESMTVLVMRNLKLDSNRIELTKPEVLPLVEPAISVIDTYEDSNQHTDQGLSEIANFKSPNEQLNYSNKAARQKARYRSLSKWKTKTRSKNFKREFESVISFNNQYVEIKSLRHFSEDLYSRLTDIMQYHDCSSSNDFDNISWENAADIDGIDPKDLVLCGNISYTPLIILINSIYHRHDKQFIFNNTLTIWPLISKDILPVLYISDYEVIQKSGGLIYKACQSGWVVSLAPKCNNNSFPVLTSLLRHSNKLWPTAKWIGFSNGDILFDTDLVQTVKYFMLEESVLPQFMVSRRWNVYLEPGTIVRTLDEVAVLKRIADIHPVTGIDLFLFNTATFPFSDIPPFVIGRPAYDNWLVHHCITSEIMIVDITNTITCVHQAVSGYSLWENSHDNQITDLKFNYQYIDNKKTIDRGYLDCVVLFTDYIPVYERPRDEKGVWKSTLITKEYASVKVSIREIGDTCTEKKANKIEYLYSQVKTMLLAILKICGLPFVIVWILYGFLKLTRYAFFPHTLKYYKTNLGTIYI